MLRPLYHHVTQENISQNRRLYLTRICPSIYAPFMLLSTSQRYTIRAGILYTKRCRAIGRGWRKSLHHLLVDGSSCILQQGRSFPKRQMYRIDSQSDVNRAY